MKRMDTDLIGGFYAVISIGIGLIGLILVTLILYSAMPAWKYMADMYCFLWLVGYLASWLIWGAGYGFAACFGWNHLKEYLRKVDS